MHTPSSSMVTKSIQFSMEVIGMKKMMEKSIINNSFNKEAAAIPSSISKKLDIQLRETDGRKVWTLAPKNVTETAVVIFLHGGAYYANLTRMHWRLIEQLVSSTRLRFIVPDYPLAPEHTYIDTYQCMDQVYAQVIEEYPNAPVVLMGDSAGGGLALGFAQQLSTQSIQQPHRSILLSPWLDVTMTNPEIANLEHRDKILSAKGLKIAGAAYAGTTELTDFRVSPLYGPLSLPGRISVFTGTNDLLLADARRLKQLLDQQQLDCDYYEYPEMVHDWTLIPQLKETKDTISRITDLLNNP